MTAAATTPAVDRSKFIGGSDAAAILGVSKWKTPYQLWLEKTGQWQQPDDPERAKVLARGKRWEPVVIEMLIDELQDRGHEVEVIGRNLRYIDQGCDFLACELDLELLVDGEECNGEMKTIHPFAAKDWGEQGTDAIPVYYTAQAMHGLMVKPRRRCIVAGLIGADDLRVHEVLRDDGVIEHMRLAEIDFWQRIRDGVPPDPVNLDDLALMFRSDDGSEVALPEGGDLHDDLLKLRAVKAKLKAYEQEEALLEFRLKRYMGEAQVLMLGGDKAASWKGQEGKRFDLETFKAEHPKLYREFQKPTSTRVFRVNAG
ncbi:MAG TPA: YqaJ viral recombinase family protein [Noviherbaspirillum sp.]